MSARKNPKNGKKTLVAAKGKRKSRTVDPLVSEDGEDEESEMNQNDSD